jgi:hypothetical protein
MIFNEHKVFDGNWEGFKDELLTININRLAEWTRKYALPDNDTISKPKGENLIEESSPAEDSEHDREFGGMPIGTGCPGQSTPGRKRNLPSQDTAKASGLILYRSHSSGSRSPVNTSECLLTRLCIFQPFTWHSRGKKWLTWTTRRRLAVRWCRIGFHTVRTDMG